MNGLPDGVPGCFGEGGPSADRAWMHRAEAEQRLALPGGFVPGGVLAHGNGRSYGDTCLRGGGFHIATMADKPTFELDLGKGLVRADAGVLLADLIKALEGTGWFPPVVPGTKLVTLGGALANDIHGKNHHLRGTFGAHVIGFELLRSDGSINWCSRQENADLYAATIGGLGLTGLVTRLEMRLMPVPGHGVLARTVPFSSLDGYFDIAEGEADLHEYAVAWIDQMAGGARAGRGLFFLGDHAEGRTKKPSGFKPFVPFRPPFPAINRLSLKAFNTTYRWAKSRRTDFAFEAPDPFFFPLDAVGDWNRLYGPRGLFQHQCVLPEPVAREAVAEMLAITRKAGEASFLTVLKRFGSVVSPGILSFPRAGHTLTLDFPNRGESTLRMLGELDRVVVAAGGRINPYKDARMSAATFAAGFPRWPEVERLRDPSFLSDFWARTALMLPPAETPTTHKMQAANETRPEPRADRTVAGTRFETGGQAA